MDIDRDADRGDIYTVINLLYEREYGCQGLSNILSRYVNRGYIKIVDGIIDMMNEKGCTYDLSQITKTAIHYNQLYMILHLIDVYGVDPNIVIDEAIQYGYIELAYYISVSI